MNNDEIYIYYNRKNGQVHLDNSYEWMKRTVERCQKSCMNSPDRECMTTCYTAAVMLDTSSPPWYKDPKGYHMCFAQYPDFERLRVDLKNQK